MNLSIEGNRFLINAPSSDNRLKELPGYGWQPTTRCWEFPEHPCIIFLSINLLGSDLIVEPEHIEKAGKWEKELDQRNGVDLQAPIIERNRYYLEHSEEDNYWASMIPSRQPAAGGSEFILHPVIKLLIDRIFGKPGNGEARPPIIEPSIIHEKSGNEISANESYLDTQEQERSESLEDPLTVAPVEHHESQTFNYTLTKLQSANDVDEWASRATEILQQAAGGDLSPSANDNSGNDGSDKHLLILQLAQEIYEQGSLNRREQICNNLIISLKWTERISLLLHLVDTSLEYKQDESVDDRALFIESITQLIGQEPLAEIEDANDILYLCESNRAYSRALTAYDNGTLFEDIRNFKRDDLRHFLFRILNWLSDRMDEASIVQAFETYCCFLGESSSPADIQELINVCTSIGDRKSLKIKSILLTAQGLHMMNTPDGGIANAIKYLVDSQNNLPSEYEDSQLVCEEARLLAVDDFHFAELLGNCKQTSDESSSNRSTISEKILVIGGNSAFKRRGTNAFQREFPMVDLIWLDIKDADNPRRLRNIIKVGNRKVLFYNWTMSHSISLTAKAYVTTTSADWETVRNPGMSGVLNAADNLLGVSP